MGEGEAFGVIIGLCSPKCQVQWEESTETYWQHGKDEGEEECPLYWEADAESEGGKGEGRWNCPPVHQIHALQIDYWAWKKGISNICIYLEHFQYYFLRRHHLIRFLDFLSTTTSSLENLSKIKKQESSSSFFLTLDPAWRWKRLRFFLTIFWSFVALTSRKSPTKTCQERICWVLQRSSGVVSCRLPSTTHQWGTLKTCPPYWKI